MSRLRLLRRITKASHIGQLTLQRKKKSASSLCWVAVEYGIKTRCALSDENSSSSVGCPIKAACLRGKNGEDSPGCAPTIGSELLGEIIPAGN